MKTADFLGTQPFTNHLQRRRTPRRLLTLCLYSALCLGGTFGFEMSVRVEEKRAEAGQKPMPEAAQAQVELENLFHEMNAFALALDPLSQHLDQPTCSGVLAGLEEALGADVSVERTSWKRAVKDDGKKRKKKKTKGEEILVLTVEAIAKNEETATSLAEVLEAYTGMAAQIQDHAPVPEAWPAVRMQIRLEGPLTSESAKQEEA
ncbi:MAG: hypothetical protein CMJ94_09420 [Planctomycetes bacterium]|nr:hypothetical protein [Planctomycetota bacterium]